MLDSARRAREAGLFTNYVTNAYMTVEALDLIGPYLNAFRADLKGFSDETYRRIAKIQAFDGILRILERAKHFWGMHVEIITNLIPGINDQLTSVPSCQTSHATVWQGIKGAFSAYAAGTFVLEPKVQVGDVRGAVRFSGVRTCTQALRSSPGVRNKAQETPSAKANTAENAQNKS